MNTAEPSLRTGSDLLGDLGNRTLTPFEMEVASRLIGVNGNEGLLSVVAEMASVSGGKLGNLKGLAAGVDQAFEARNGSRSVNLSAGARIEDEGDQHSFPIVHGQDDLNVAEAAIYVHLEEAGVSSDDLNRAMSEGGWDNPRETFAAFSELASDHGLTEIVDYIQDTDAVAHGAEIEAGVKDVAPITGTALDVEPPQNDLENTLDQQGPSVAGLKM